MGPWEKYQQAAPPAAPPAAGPWQKYAQQTAAPAAPVEEDSWLDTALGWGGDLIDAQMGAGAAGLSGIVNEALPMGLGGLVEAVNASPMLLNLLPGEQGMEPFSERPVGGVENWRDVLQGPNEAVNAVAGTDLDIDYEPRNVGERIAKRVGQEAGLAALPVGGAAVRAQRVGEAGLKALSPLERYFVEPMVRNPSGVMQQEALYASASGTGAQIANEMVDPEGGEGTALSDLFGSLGGTAGLSAVSSLGRAGQHLAGAATNNPRWMNEVVDQAVASQIINNSSMMSAQAEPFMLRGAEPQLDTGPLASLLRQETELERAVPGYRADIGDRSMDPRLQTFAQDANARVAGAGNARNTANTAAVNERVAGVAPQGDPAAFRAALQGGVDQRLSDVVTEEELARLAFDEAASFTLPQQPNETARGSNIRAGLQGAYDTALDETSQLYQAIDAGDFTVDPAALAARFGAVDESLPLADRQRFRPAGADVPFQLVPEEGTAPVPLREATAVRSGLSSDVQAARAASEPRRASIAGQYRDELDRFLAEELDPEAAAAYGEANRARFDVGRRFEESGTAIEAALRRTERGGYQIDASALPRKFVQPDTGKISDYQALVREAGQDQGVREAIADQMRADIQPFLNNPERLQAYMQEHGIVLEDFPELRGQMERTGAARTTLAGAEAERATTTKQLTTPGQSPEASYLYGRPGQPFGNEQTRTSVARIINDPDPRAAVQRVLRTAGDDPAARADLRAAFWEEVKGRGQNSATDMAGQDVWNARKVREMLDDPKSKAVMEELWADDPGDLEDIRSLFTALEKATPGRARAPGSSGTAQALVGGDNGPITTRRIVSDIRSVKLGKMSPVVAGAGLLANWMSKKSAQTQTRAIDTLTAQVINTPGLAADLLDEFNPATYAAKRRMLTQKYGVRASGALALLDNAMEEYESDGAP